MRGRVVWALGLVVVAATAAGTVMAAPLTMLSNGTINVVRTSGFGKVLVGWNGHTLYRYTVDSKNVNRCTNVPACNTYWPALLVKAGTRPTVGVGASAKLVGTIHATHGMRQVTYGGYPLYFFAGDKNAGQMNGEGFEKKWYLVGTNATLIQHGVKASPPTSSAPASSGGGYGYG